MPRAAPWRPACGPRSSTSSAFASFLYTAGQPDPDLLIRTSGEMRVSNYLLWQIAYSEIYVTDTLWPDFRAPHLIEAVLAYQKRERRYGGISAPRRHRRQVTAVIREVSCSRVDRMPSATSAGRSRCAVALAAIRFCRIARAARRWRAVVAALAAHEYRRTSRTAPTRAVVLVRSRCAGSSPASTIARRSSLLPMALLWVAAEVLIVGPSRLQPAPRPASFGAPSTSGMPLGMLVAVQALRAGARRCCSRHDRRQRFGAVLHRPRCRPPTAGAGDQPEEDDRRRHRRPRLRHRVHGCRRRAGAAVRRLGPLSCWACWSSVAGHLRRSVRVAAEAQRRA